ncbi:MAG: isoprenylcysteine carboxylmethyltransferase family protein [Verrucomicrobia bacterium]|nr:isoprenylcysteine carboxylmethyltransferase family protein [Verrucomicrobiota bacterium]
MSSFLRKGGLWVVVQNVLTLAVVVVGPIHGARDWASPWRVLGIALFAVGAIFGITGVRTLGRNRTPFPEPVAEHELVQTGVYAVVRHPLYSSLIFLSFGWALAWFSTVTLALAGGLALVLDQKSRVEERFLRDRYTDYHQYAQRVRRLIPGVY